MKYNIELSNRFKKSFKKLNQQERAIFKEIIEKLANNEILDEKYLDHPLKGDLSKYRECHLKPNLLLIYQKQDTKLIIYCLDIGSHSELF